MYLHPPVVVARLSLASLAVPSYPLYLFKHSGSQLSLNIGPFLGTTGICMIKTFN